MKLKTYFLMIVLTACYIWPASGYADNIDKYIVSVQSTNGLALGITIIDTKDGQDTIDLPRQWLFKSPTNTHSMLFMPKEEYLVRMELYDSSNNPVAKTELGKKYGESFDDIYWDINKYAKRPHGHTKVSDTWSFGYDLPKTSELFVVTKPDEYRLKLEVQIMLYFLDMTKRQTRQIIRFPPIEIKVKKL